MSEPLQPVMMTPTEGSAAVSSPSRLQTSWGSVRRAAGRGLAVLGGGALLSSALLAYARYRAQKADASLPAEFLLDLDLSRLSVVESAPASPLAVLQGGFAEKVELRKVVRALQLAGKDARVKGVIAQLGGRQNLAGVATVEELRSAVQSFRHVAGARGATTIAHAAAFGEAGANGTLQYYLASSFDKVYMQPSGQVGLLGLQSQLLFFRGLLDKLKVEPIFYTRGDYKTAAHIFTQHGFTPQHKENVEALLQSLVGSMWHGCSQARGLTPEQVEAAVAAAPLLAQPAAQPVTEGGYGLLDGLKYLDEVVSSLLLSPTAQEKRRADAKQQQAASGGSEVEPDVRLPRVPITKYLLVKEVAEQSQSQQGLRGWLSQGPWQGLVPSSWGDATQQQAYDRAGLRGGAAPLPITGPRTAEAAGWVPRQVGRGRPKVAVVHAVGAIVQGPVLPGPGGSPPGQQVIDASKLSQQLAQLAEARDVAAVVLRVSSPGGSALGSDTLHHALTRIKAAGKPLVVSCGDVAASGGMFLAVAGDRIFAQPGTLTGSIGVVTGKVDASGLAAELGINPASVERGSPNLSLQSPFGKPDAGQDAKINQLMDSIYHDFLGKVAEGRGMSVEAVRKLAGGRVYTGEQAHKVGLVDELGGLAEAVEAAKKLANLPAEEDKVMVFDYPPKRVPLLLRLLQGSMTPPGNGASLWAVREAAHMEHHQHDPIDASLAASYSSSPVWHSLLPPAVLSWLLGSSAHHMHAGVAHPAQAVVTASAIQTALHGVLGSGTDGSTAVSLAAAVAAAPGTKQVVQAVASSMSTASLLQGQVCCYAPEAQMLNDLIA